MARHWDDFAYFIEVARTSSLTAAANALNTSASTVSRHIDALEARLGTRLFLRQSRGYALTQTGHELLGRVSEVERAIMAVERMGSVSQQITGEIKLAAPESVAHYLILPHLPQLARDYPGLRVELLVTRYRADLARREADIAVRIAEPWQRDFAPDAIVKLIGKFQFGLFCESRLLSSVPDWQTLPHISWDTSWTKLPMVEWLKAKFPGQVPVLRTNSMQAHYQAAYAGVGVAMLPCFLVRRAGGLIEIPSDMSHTQHELWLMHHEDLRSSESVRVVKEFLTRIFAEELQ